MRNLWLWGNDDYPDLDSKCMLLAYLYCLQWKGGTIFPSEKEINLPPADGIYVTSMSDSEFTTAIEKIFRDLLGRTEKLTSHTPRKTGYLFAVFRGMACVASMMVAAGHVCTVVTLRYLKDTQAVWSLVQNYTDPEQQLGNSWKSCHCAASMETCKAIIDVGKEWQISKMCDLVKGFIETTVGIDMESTERRLTPLYVYQKVVN